MKHAEDLQMNKKKETAKMEMQVTERLTGMIVSGGKHI